MVKRADCHRPPPIERFARSATGPCRSLQGPVQADPHRLRSDNQLFSAVFRAQRSFALFVRGQRNRRMARDTNRRQSIPPQDLR